VSLHEKKLSPTSIAITHNLPVKHTTMVLQNRVDRFRAMMAF